MKRTAALICVMALVLAGLAAEGETHVHKIEHVDRGCEHFEEDLALLGANIIREEDGFGKEDEET